MAVKPSPAPMAPQSGMPLPPFEYQRVSETPPALPALSLAAKISAASARVAGRLCRSASLSSAITAARAAANERSMRVER